MAEQGDGQAVTRAVRRLLRRVTLAAAVAVLVILRRLLWEGYKALDRRRRCSAGELPARTDDRSMPHVWDDAQRFGDPERRGADAHPWACVVLDGAWYTFRVAMVGLVIGVAVGLALAVADAAVPDRRAGPAAVRRAVADRAVVALAPLVVGWGGRLSTVRPGWQPWMSVAVIAAYLAFFPVAVGALRGLHSPPPESVELMDSYAAGWWRRW